MAKNPETMPDDEVNSMHYRRLGGTNLDVSVIGLGLLGVGSKSWREWVLEYEEARPILDAAVESGINLFDTCNFYSLGESESLLGRFVEDRNIRDQVVIATKCGNRFSNAPNDGGYSKKGIIKAAEKSLARLRTDYIDILQTHIWERATRVDEVLEAFEHLQNQGKVLYSGFTNPPSGVTSEAVDVEHARQRRVWHTVQIEYNFLRDEPAKSLLASCRQMDKGGIAYGPFARGFIKNDHQKPTLRLRNDEYIEKWYGGEEDQAKLDRLDDYRTEHQYASRTDAALGWVLSQPNISTVLIGASSASQLRANIDCALSTVSRLTGEGVEDA